MINGAKELLRGLAKQNIDFFKKAGIIEEGHTGKIILEMNLNQGSLTDVKVSPEIRA